jgi:cyclase
MRKSFFSLVLITILSISGLSQQKDTLIKIADGVYEITGLGGNVSFLVTDEGVCVVDAGSNTNDGAKIVAHIRSVTDKPVKQIIITHYHYDHVGGLATLPADATIIGHKNTPSSIKGWEESVNQKINVILPHKIDSLRRALEQIVSATSIGFIKTDSSLKATVASLDKEKQTKVVYPNVLVDSIQNLFMGKDTIVLIHPGKAHTDGDLVVYFKSRKILVMGDLLFNRCYPYADPLGSVENWAVQMKTFADYDARCFIPGHASLADKKDMLLYAGYLTDLFNAVKKLKSEGKSLDEIKQTVKLPVYDNFGYKFFFMMNIEGVYNQIK